MKRFIVMLCAIAAFSCIKDAVALPVEQAVVREKPVAILNQDSEVNPDGTHYNVWESENGIKVQEEGIVTYQNDDHVVHSVNGRISYNDENGKPIVLTYVADENGFQPQGDHLPTAPPVPQSVARALEYIAAHPHVEKEYPEVTKRVVH